MAAAGGARVFAPSSSFMSNKCTNAHPCVVDLPVALPPGPDPDSAYPRPGPRPTKHRIWVDPNAPLSGLARQGLLDALTLIDSEGWEGSTATALLECVRTERVCWLAIDAGLRGPAAPKSGGRREPVASMARRTAYPNAYPNGSPSGRVRVYPGLSLRGSDLHRRTQADVGERVSGA